MELMNELGNRIKSLRLRKGLSHEQLARASRISLRTIQRIELGETKPRGETLAYLATALDVSPDDVLEWAPAEDRGYLTLLNLSGLAFYFNPVLGIVVPALLWIYKRDKVKGVNRTGKRLLNFQITMTVATYLTVIIASGGQFISSQASFRDLIYAVFYQFSVAGLTLLLIHSLVLFMSLFNGIRDYRAKKVHYLPAIPLLR